MGGTPNQAEKHPFTDVERRPRLRRKRRVVAARRCLFALLLTLTISLAASTLVLGLSAAHAATAPSACTLLVAGDLQAVLGGNVGPGDLTTAPNGAESICQWTVTTPNGGGFGVQLDVKSPFSKQMFKAQRRLATGSTKTLKQLGDTAFSERARLEGQTYDDVWVHSGDLAFRLEALKKLGPNPLVSLAKTVLMRLAVPPS